MTTKRTQKELKPMIKKDVDAFAEMLMEKYPEITRTSLVNFISTELSWAIDEINHEGRVLTNKERWG